MEHDTTVCVPHPRHTEPNGDLDAGVMVRATRRLALTAAVVLPTQMLVGLSAYMLLKLALIKFIEFLAVENPNLFIVALQPGIVETCILRKSGADASLVLMDQVDLPANFQVWLTSPEAAVLNGRHVWSNWDVKELKKKAEEIQSGSLLTAGIYGWPFQP